MPWRNPCATACRPRADGEPDLPEKPYFVNDYRERHPFGLRQRHGARFTPQRRHERLEGKRQPGEQTKPMATGKRQSKPRQRTEDFENRFRPTDARQVLPRNPAEFLSDRMDTAGIGPDGIAEWGPDRCGRTNNCAVVRTEHINRLQPVLTASHRSWFVRPPIASRHIATPIPPNDRRSVAETAEPPEPTRSRCHQTRLKPASPSRTCF